MQLMKQLTFCVQFGLALQLVSSLQQLFATQFPQVEPSDGHIGWLPHTPPEQMPVQHCVPFEHIPPSGVQVMHCELPHSELTSSTQMPSQETLQQKGSNWQIVVTHGSHPDISAGPTVHRSWAHGPVTPQMPLLQVPLQHCPPTLHMPPSGVH
jgi:hypothetical protein